MKNLLCLYLILLIAIPCSAKISREGHRVDIIVDTLLFRDNQVKEAVKFYAEAVNYAYGIKTNIYGFTPASKGGTAPELKKVIQDSYNNTKDGKLDGVILMGDLPRATMELASKNDEGIQYQRWTTEYYFMDMDGIWLDTASGWSSTKEFGTGGFLKDSILKTPIFNFGDNGPFDGAPSDTFSIRFEGFIKASKTGLCSLKVVSDNNRKIYIDDNLIIAAWIGDWDVPYYGTIQFKKDSLYAFMMEYADNYGGANMSLYYKYEDEPDWTAIPDSSWRLDKEGKKQGIKASYFANLYLQDSIPHLGEPNGWKSGVSNGIFDGHYSKSGAISDSFEIWVSRVDPQTAGFHGSPKMLLLNWLDKATASQLNRNYHKRAAFFAKEDVNLEDASVNKFLKGFNYIYGNNIDTLLVEGNGYLHNIANDYDWATYTGHGNPTGLANGFGATSFNYSYEVQPRIFHFASCSPTLAYNYFGTANGISVASSIVFGTSKGGLAAIGATKTSGGNQLDDLMYYPMRDSLLGEAYLSWVNQRIKKNTYSGTGIYDWFYVEQLIGDPFISMDPEMVTEPPETFKIHPRSQYARPMVFKERSFDAKGRLLKGSKNVRIFH